MQWKSSRHNMGMTFDRNTWNAIKDCKDVCQTIPFIHWFVRSFVRSFIFFNYSSVCPSVCRVYFSLLVHAFSFHPFICLSAILFLLKSLNVHFGFTTKSWMNRCLFNLVVLMVICFVRFVQTFCSYDDYNWDWTLMKISLRCVKRAFSALVMKTPRIFHIGEWYDIG